jgi:ABC-type bacteriocin/lantibiotic exporter with double-glycine peptidase domain
MRTTAARCGHLICARTPRFEQDIPEEQWPDQFRLLGRDREHWSDRTCGLACLMSVSSFHGRAVPPILELLREGAGSGYYTGKGWIHAGLASLGAAYGLRGEARQAATVDDLRSCLESTGGPLIASVTLRFPEDGRRGGHLVVVTAAGEGPGARICIRDPSSWGKGEDSVSAARFSASYSGRVIIFY